MSQNMKALLLDDRWAPVTSEMGFLEMDAGRAALAYAAWQGGLLMDRGFAVEARQVSGSLEQVLSALLPLYQGENRRCLFIPTRSAWTGYVDAASTMPYMAQVLGCRGMRVVAIPNTIRGDKGRYGMVALEVYGPQRTHWLNYVRGINAANDGGRWVFVQTGEPFPFERLEQYQARRVRGRFTFDMLREYLHHLGPSPFEESFYLPEGAPAWLVEAKGPVLPHDKEYTLEQAREDF